MARFAGQSVDALAARMKSRLGGVAASQVYSLGVQLNRMKEDLLSLFGGATLDPFLSGLRNITSMFSQTSETGRDLKKYLGGAFDSLLRMATAALPYVKGAIIGAGTGAVNIYIAFLKAKNAIFGAIGPTITVQNAIDAARIATMIFVGSFVILGLVAAAAVGAIVAAVYVLVRTVQAALAFWGRVGDAIVAMFEGAKAWLANVSLADVALNMISSLVSVIVGPGVALAGAAFLKLGAAAKAGLKSALGIHSPSRVAVEAAENVTGTFSGKVREGAPEARDSFDKFSSIGKVRDDAPADLDRLSSPQVVRGDAKAARGTGGARIVYIERGAFGESDERGILDKVRAIMRGEFEAEVYTVEPAR